MQVVNDLISVGGEELVLSNDLNWLSQYPVTGGDMYVTMAFGAGLVPNKAYMLAAMAAEYYGYESIQIGEGCD